LPEPSAADRKQGADGRKVYFGGDPRSSLAVNAVFGQVASLRQRETNHASSSHLLPGEQVVTV
jgi:hypothetical protein